MYSISKTFSAEKPCKAIKKITLKPTSKEILWFIRPSAVEDSGAEPSSESALSGMNFEEGVGSLLRMESYSLRRRGWSVKTTKRYGTLSLKLAYCWSELSTLRPGIQPGDRSEANLWKFW